MSRLSKLTAFVATAAVAIALSTGTFADGKKAEHKGHGPHYMGEIVSIDKDSLKLKTHDGEVTVALTSDTKFGGKDEAKTVSDFKAGDKVFVGYKEEDGKKVATRVGIPHHHEKK